MAPQAHAGCASYAQNGSATDGYYLDNGCTAIINNYSPCRVVTNSTGATLFIPSYYPASTSSVGQAEWSSFLAGLPAGVSAASCSCAVPWGGTLSPGQSVTAYQASSAPCHGSCASQTRTCTCTDSSSLCVLSGSYTKQSCSVAACAACSLPWGGSIADSQSVGAYAAASVACGSSCSGQTRTCNNGSLSGSYANQTCSVQPCPCTKPWGGQIASGASVTAYRYASVACGSSCTSQNRICSNGTLSGSYTNQNCSVGSCGCAATTYTWTGGGGTCSGSLPNMTEGQAIPLSFDFCPLGSGGTWGSVTVTCTGGSLVPSGASCQHQTCFTAGTYVLMANGTSKLIENLKVGDRVRGAGGINTVVGLPNYNNPTPIYGFNGGKPFVTGGHPFWTAQGWKAIDPRLTPRENHNVKTAQLRVGDVLRLDNGQAFVITSIDQGHRAGPHHVFDPQVNGDHTYYANGLLVHNKRACSGGGPACDCGPGCTANGTACWCTGSPYATPCL